MKKLEQKKPEESSFWENARAKGKANLEQTWNKIWNSFGTALEQTWNTSAFDLEQLRSGSGTLGTV